MRKLFLWALASFLLVSCDTRQVYDQYRSLPGQWHKDSVVSFALNKLDTAQTYNLFINIRNNHAYPYQNLYLITAMNFPNGKVVTDTLQYEMAYPDGRWMGSGFSDIKENKLWYKENVRFTEKGTYTINIRHAMRKIDEVDGVQNLPGITEVGFRIEKTTP